MGSTTKCKWTKESMEMLINLYEERPNLFDCNDKDYYHRVKRVKSLGEISYYLKEFNNYSIEEIKNKIKCIRSQYSREKLLVEKSKQSGADPNEVYEPKIWFYDRLHFLETSKTNPAKHIEFKKEKSFRNPSKQIESQKEKYFRSSAKQIEFKKEKCFRSPNNRSFTISPKNRKKSEERQSTTPAFADCVGEELANIKDVKILRDTKKEIMKIIWIAQEKDEEKYEDLLNTYRISESPTTQPPSPISLSPIPQTSSFDVDPLMESTYSSSSPSPILKVTPVSICYLPLSNTRPKKC